MISTESTSMTRVTPTAMTPTAAVPTTVAPLTVPTIAFGRFHDGTAAEREAIAARIIAAGETYGFFYLSDNGVPRTQIDAAFDAARAFFALPLADRMACRAGEKRQNRGYQPMFDTQQRAEATPDGKESFDMGFPFPADDPGVMAGLPFHGRNTWPELPGFRDTIEGLYNRLLTTGHDVLRAMALGLGADPELFARQCQRPSTNMRLVHYPPQDQIAGRTDKGAGAHTDRGLITLLLNDNEAGLEVQSLDGAWIAVPPQQDALIVNVGQLMTRWTNGRLRSAVHRVINASGRERYSIPQFHHPDYHTVVDPRDLPLTDEPAFDAVVAGDFVAKGFGADRASWKTA